MNFILEYSEYNDLQLPRRITLSNSERIEIGNVINDYLSKTYKMTRFQKEPFEIGGKVIYPEYLFKTINNRTLLKTLILDPDKIFGSKIYTKDDLYNYIIDNSFDLFHYEGKFFNEVYRLIVTTSKKGRRFENAAFKKFEEIAQLKGINAKVQDPSIKEDVFGGIDGIFYHNNRKFTIQVKPLHKIEDYRKDPTKYIIFCDGVLKELKTDYLIVTNGNDTFIFRSKDVEVNPSFFLASKTSLVQ